MGLTGTVIGKVKFDLELGLSIRQFVIPLQQFKNSASRKYKPLQPVLDFCQYHASEDGYLVVRFPSALFLWECKYYKTPESVEKLFRQRVEGLAKLARSNGFRGIILTGGRVEITA